MFGTGEPRIRRSSLGCSAASTPSSSRATNLLPDLGIARATSSNQKPGGRSQELGSTVSGSRLRPTRSGSDRRRVPRRRTGKRKKRIGRQGLTRGRSMSSMCWSWWRRCAADRAPRSGAIAPGRSCTRCAPRSFASPRPSASEPGGTSSRSRRRRRRPDLAPEPRPVARPLLGRPDRQEERPDRGAGRLSYPARSRRTAITSAGARSRSASRTSAW